MIPRTETPKSSNVAWFEHGEDGILTVAFKNGGVYAHIASTPEEQIEIDTQAQNLLKNHTEGGSVGSFYHHYIKTNEDIPTAKRMK